MRVLLVSSGSGSRGGGEIFLDYLGQGLARRGHKVVVWLPRHARMDELAEKCARFARVIRSDYRNTYDYRSRSIATCLNWGAAGRIAAEWTALAPDVIHINKQNLEDGLDLLRATRHCAAPSVCTVHLTQSARYLRAKGAGLRDWIARRELARYRGVLVAVQEQRRAALSDFLGEDAQTRTIFNGVPTIDLRQARDMRADKRRELGLSERDFLILGVGRLEEQKRPFEFTRVAAELHRRVPQATFLWVGDGRLAERWKDEIAREGLASVIRCAGWQADVLPYLLAGDLLLHVAEFEGLPFALIEAMAAGLACAVTRELTNEIPLFDENNILLLDDEKSLALKIGNPRVIARIAEAGHRLVANELSLTKMSESYERLYLEIGQRGSLRSTVEGCEHPHEGESMHADRSRPSS